MPARQPPRNLTPQPTAIRPAGQTRPSLPLRVHPNKLGRAGRPSGRHIDSLHRIGAMQRDAAMANPRDVFALTRDLCIDSLRRERTPTMTVRK